MKPLGWQMIYWSNLVWIFIIDWAWTLTDSPPLLPPILEGVITIKPHGISERITCSFGWAAHTQIYKGKGQLFNTLKYSYWGLIFIKRQFLNDPCYKTKNTISTNKRKRLRASKTYKWKLLLVCIWQNESRRKWEVDKRNFECTHGFFNKTSKNFVRNLLRGRREALTGQ